ncbi:hypothetical protein B0H11DRAFT_2241121 [Mycena galericulata]|nr:hypothetical protein B0H11DRAFT_2241121 [Mycena galericulata]
MLGKAWWATSQAFGAAQIRLLTQIFVHNAALSHRSATSGPPNSPLQKEKTRKPHPALERASTSSRGFDIAR